MIKDFIINQSKKGFFLYQRAMWYVSQAGSEFGKPLRFYSEFALLLLLMDKFGINFGIATSIFVYGGIILFAIATGKVLAITGVVKYNASLTNNHNKELTEILTRVRRLEDGRNSKKNL